MDAQQSLEAMKRLRQERGVRPEARERTRRATKAWKAIRKALEAADSAVPEIAESAGLSTEEVFWHVNAMRKYGEVEIAGEDGSYLRYRLVRKA